VRQILINIVGNSVKYCKTNGLIKVDTAVTDKGALRIVIQDNGIGIPKNRIQEALEPFGQIHMSADSANAIQGTGLGLPLAKAMTELHDGTLKLDSDLGKGTTVTIELPAGRLQKKKEAAANAPASGLSPFAGFGLKKAESAK